jgi:hypothetical protein
MARIARKLHQTTSTASAVIEKKSRAPARGTQRTESFAAARPRQENALAGDLASGAQVPSPQREVFGGASAVALEPPKNLQLPRPPQGESHGKAYVQCVADGWLWRGSDTSRLLKASEVSAKTIKEVKGLLSHQIHSVLDLQEPEDWHQDKRLADKYGFKAIAAPINDYSTDHVLPELGGRGTPTDSHMLDIMNHYGDPANRPMLVHCYAGHERTSLVVAILLVLDHDADLETALTNAKAYGMEAPEQQQYVRDFVAKARAGEFAKTVTQTDGKLQISWSRSDAALTERPPA